MTVRTAEEGGQISNLNEAEFTCHFQDVFGRLRFPLERAPVSIRGNGKVKSSVYKLISDARVLTAASVAFSVSHASYLLGYWKWVRRVLLQINSAVDIQARMLLALLSTHEARKIEDIQNFLASLISSGANNAASEMKDCAVQGTAAVQFVGLKLLNAVFEVLESGKLGPLQSAKEAIEEKNVGRIYGGGLDASSANGETQTELPVCKEVLCRPFSSRCCNHFRLSTAARSWIALQQLIQGASKPILQRVTMKNTHAVGTLQSCYKGRGRCNTDLVKKRSRLFQYRLGYPYCLLLRKSIRQLMQQVESEILSRNPFFVACLKESHPRLLRFAIASVAFSTLRRVTSTSIRHFQKRRVFGRVKTKSKGHRIRDAYFAFHTIAGAACLVPIIFRFFFGQTGDTRVFCASCCSKHCQRKTDYLGNAVSVIIKEAEVAVRTAVAEPFGHPQAVTAINVAERMLLAVDSVGVLLQRHSSFNTLIKAVSTGIATYKGCPCRQDKAVRRNAHAASTVVAVAIFVAAIAATGFGQILFLLRHAATSILHSAVASNAIIILSRHKKSRIESAFDGYRETPAEMTLERGNAKYGGAQLNAKELLASAAAFLM